MRWTESRIAGLSCLSSGAVAPCICRMASSIPVSDPAAPSADLSTAASAAHDPAEELGLLEEAPSDRVVHQHRCAASVSSPAASASVISVARMAAGHPVSRAGM